MPLANSADGVAVDSDTHTVYVANYGHPTVSVIDGSTHTVTASVHVGNDPFGVAVDPNTHFVYVTNFSDNTVSVIDGSTHKVVANRARRLQPGRGRGGPGHPHRLRHQLRRPRGLGDQGSLGPGHGVFRSHTKELNVHLSV